MPNVANTETSAGDSTTVMDASLSLSLKADSGYTSHIEDVRITVDQWSRINQILNEM